VNFVICGFGFTICKIDLLQLDSTTGTVMSEILFTYLTY